MNGFDSKLADLHSISIDIYRIEQELSDLSRSRLSPGLEAEKRDYLQDRLDRTRAMQRRYAVQIAEFPPQHERHLHKLPQFWNEGGYGESVFIMTKFPTGEAAEDHQLSRVIEATRAAVVARGYKPRVASDEKFHPMLWDNVELYLAGCRVGVAIVEDRYQPELNPNVAMEWGWMRGMGKEVIFLVEKQFQHLRADWDGLIKDVFDWEYPETTILEALTRNLRLRTPEPSRL